MKMGAIARAINGTINSLSFFLAAPCKVQEAYGRSSKFKKKAIGPLLIEKQLKVYNRKHLSGKGRG